MIRELHIFEITCDVCGTIERYEQTRQHPLPPGWDHYETYGWGTRDESREHERCPICFRREKSEKHDE